MIAATLAFSLLSSMASAGTQDETPEERAEAIVLKAQAAMREGDPESAIALCREALAIDPDSDPAYFRLAEAYGRSGRPIESFDAFDRSILAGDGILHAEYVRGMQRNHARFDAEDLSRRLENPGAADVPSEMFAARACCWLMMEDFEKAESDAKHAVRRDARNPYGHFAMALVLLETRGWDPAVESLKRAEELAAPGSSLSETVARVRADHDREDWPQRRRRLAIATALAREPAEDERKRLVEEWDALVERQASERAARAEAVAAEKRARAVEDVRKLLDAASAAFDRGEFADALERCEEARAALPDSAPAAILLAKVLHAMGDDERATDATYIDEVTPELKELRLEYGMAAFRKLLAASGAAKEEKLPEASPDGEDHLAMHDLVAEAIELQNDGALDAALVRLYEAARRAPRAPEPYEIMAHVLNRSSRFEEAFVACDKWIRRLEAGRFDTSIAREQAAAIVRARSTAYAAVEKSLESAPDDYDTWLRLCALRIHQIDLTGAAEAAERMIAIDPRRPRGYAYRAEILDRAGAPPGLVLADCERARQLDPSDRDAGILARRVHARLGETDWVMNDIAREIGLARPGRDLAKLLIERAWLHMESGEYAKAAADFTASFEQEPQHFSPATRGRREAWLKTGDFQSVLDDTARVLQVTPNDRATMRQRWQALLLAGDEQGAAELATRIEESEIAASGDSGRGRARRHDAMAVAAGRRGDVGAALTACRRALEADPHFEDARLRRAILFEMADDEARAAEDARDSAVANEKAAELLRRVQQEGYTPTDSELQEYSKAVSGTQREPKPSLSRNDAIKTVILRERSTATPWVLTRVLSEYLEETPDDVELLELRARLFTDMIGDEAAKQALADVSRLIELRPRDAGYPTWQASLRAELGDVEGALESFGKAIALVPANPYVVVARGTMLHRVGKARKDAALVDRALADARRAIEIRPIEEAYRLAAYIHEERGEVTEALRCADEIRRIAPLSSIPDLPNAYAARAREELQRDTERLAREKAFAELREYAERNRAEEAARRAADEEDPYEKFAREFQELMDGGGSGQGNRYRGLWDDGSWEANWRAGGRLQQKLDAEDRFNERCREVERRFGSGAAERERDLRPR